MSQSYEKTITTWQRAAKVMPYGVTSNFRYWSEEETAVVKRADGAYVWDMDDNRYIDYRLGFGPIILGHNHPQVNQSVIDAINNGAITTAHTHMLEIEVAERIVAMCPGVDKVRFANSGTEATMHALRIARGYTGRDKVVKFEGCYHGFYDYMLFSTASTPAGVLGSRRSSIPVPTSSGIPRMMSDLLILLPYNDIEALDRAVRAKWGEIAAIIVEPVMGNSAGVPANREWYAHLRKLCDEYGIVMIADEVKTGFRLAKGGAGEYFGIHGDLMTYAKCMGNGFPVAAIGGSDEVMSVVGPGQVGQGGTYAGNAVATAAAKATLDVIANTDALERASEHGRKLSAGIDAILTEAGLPHVMTGVESMPGFVFSEGDAPVDFRGVMATDLDLYESLGMMMREMGVEYEPDPREPLFISAAHSDADADEVLSKMNDAVQKLKKIA